MDCAICEMNTVAPSELHVLLPFLAPLFRNNYVQQVSPPSILCHGPLTVMPVAVFSTCRAGTDEVRFG